MEFTALLNEAKSLLILIPANPSLDSVAAGLSLYLSIREKKEATIVSSSPMTVEFNRLVGVNKISTESGDKNLAIKFVSYDSNGIERVSYDIEGNDFKLTVIPKPGMAAPKKDQIELFYSGISADTIVLVGGKSHLDFPQIDSKDSLGAKIVHIGITSFSNEGARDIISFARPASSISEIMASLIKEMGESINPDISTNLLMGIEEGSNSFTAPQVTANTFEIIASLMKAGGRRTPRVSQPRASFYPLGSIPGGPLEEVERKETPKDWLGPKIYKGTSVS